jgi:hypothetical protein
MARRGYLVVGPESSGTKLTAELLRRAGCRSAATDGGGDGSQLAFDEHPPLVWCTFPHGRLWPKIAHLVPLLNVHEVYAVVTTRDWFAMSESQVNRRLAVDRQTAVGNIRRAYHEIFSGIGALGLPFLVSSHEAMMSQRGYTARLLDMLRLPPASFEMYEPACYWTSA